MSDLPRFIRDLISSPPPAGAGVHSWLFRCARQLHAHRGAPEIESLLAAAIAGCGRNVPTSEIRDAVENSVGCAWQPGARGPAVTGAPPTWPAVDESRRAEVVVSGFCLADLWEASPVRLDTDSPCAEGIIDALFPGNPLLCVGADQRSAVTQPRDALRGRMERMQFVVPSPMSAPTGTTQDGRPSPRTLSNVGPRRFLVVEFDTGAIDEHAAILGHLADYAPLVMVVHSGGKSLHGWFCGNRDESVTRRFFSYAASLGADTATWTRCQFVRMPGGRRANGVRQVVWFFNPKAAHAD